MGSSSSPRRVYCLRVLCLRLPRRCISGKYSDKGVKRNVWMVARSSAFDRRRDHGRFCERGESDFGFYLERDDAVAV